VGLEVKQPFGTSPKTLGGDFIQEGADNIELNTETIDGKNTMHSMARAVFQVVQDHTPTSEISSTKIKRGQERSLSSCRANPKLNGVKLFLCNDIIISVTAIHFLALSCDNAL
jgi:hypothetical protein